MNIKQKENTAKLFYDFCKIIFAVAIVGPVVQPEKFDAYRLIAGIIASIAFYIFAYLIDKMK